MEFLNRLEEARLLEALLGTAMRRQQVLDELISFGFGADDIDNEMHRSIWEVAMDLRRKKQPADPAVVSAMLLARGHDERDVAEFVSACIRGLTVEVESGRVRPFMDTLRRRVALRRVIELARVVATEGGVDGASATSLVSRFNSEAARIVNAASTVTGASGKDLADIVAAMLRGETEPTRRTPTWIPAIDRLTDGGIPDGTFFTLAARSGIGKSTYARYVAVENAMRGLGVLYVSTEMPRVPTAPLVAAQMCGVRIKGVGDNLSASEHAALQESIGRLSKMPIWFEDQTGMTAEEIAAKIHRYKRDYDIRLVIIDYVQKIARSRVRLDRSDLYHVHTSNVLEEALKENKVGGLFMAQLKKPDPKSTVKNDDEMPADSECYFKDASYYATVWRDKNNQDAKLSNLSKISLRKNRYNDGAQGDGYLLFDRGRMVPSDHRGDTNPDMFSNPPPEMPAHMEDDDAPF